MRSFTRMLRAGAPLALLTLLIGCGAQPGAASNAGAPAAGAAASSPAPAVVLSPTTPPTPSPEPSAEMTPPPRASIAPEPSAPSPEPSVDADAYNAPAAEAAEGAAPDDDLSPTQLRYQLLDRFGPLFFCDPDLYPVARPPDPQEISQRVTEIELDDEEYQAIVDHLGLAGQKALSAEQRLLVYDAHKQLQAIELTPAEDGYQFSLSTSNDGGQSMAIAGSIALDGTISVTSQEPTVSTCG